MKKILILILISIFVSQPILLFSQPDSTYAQTDSDFLKEVEEIEERGETIADEGPEVELSNQLDSLTFSLSELKTLSDYTGKKKIFLNPLDLEAVSNYLYMPEKTAGHPIKKPIIQMLTWLVTPRQEGGAGHERIKVKRIRRSYDSEKRGISRESEGAENISAHHNGQAVDISEIDCIKCTLIKRRRIGSDKKIRRPPIPIKVIWQSESGYLEGGGPQAFAQALHGVFFDLATGSLFDSLIELVADAIGIDLEKYPLRGRKIEEIARYIGLAWLADILDIPSLDRAILEEEDFLSITGKAILAKALNLPSEGLRGNSPEDWFENTGRAVTEEKIGLPAGSLEGENSSQILSSLGQRFLEETLDLPRGKLKKEGIPKDLIGNEKVNNNLLVYQKDPKRDQAFGLPIGLTRKILAGEKIDWKEVGIYRLGIVLANQGAEQEAIQGWLRTGNPQTGQVWVDEADLSSQYGLKEGEMEKIFLKNKAKEVFKKIGMRTIFYSLKGISLSGKLLDPNDSSNPASLSEGEIKVIAEGDLGLKKKDIILVLRGEKKISDLAIEVGARKIALELELDPQQVNEAIWEIKEGADPIRVLSRYFGQDALLLAASILNKEFNLEEKYGFYLTPKDISTLIRGDWKFLEKAGIAALEKTFKIPSGELEKVIKEKKDPLEVLAAAGGQRVALMLGLSRPFPISMEGNIFENIGQAKIEEYLGLDKGSFRGNLDQVAEKNGIDKMEYAFSISFGYWNQARDKNSSFWQEKENEDMVKNTDLILGISPGWSKKLLIGEITIEEFTKKVTASTLEYLASQKLFEFFGVDREYNIDLGVLKEIYRTDPKLEKPENRVKVYNLLEGVFGTDLDGIIGFDRGTIAQIIASPKEAEKILLEQGKKMFARFINLPERHFESMDRIFEKGEGEVIVWEGPRPTPYEELLIEKIKEGTGIPDTEDVKSFLVGDVKRGLLSYGLAQLVQFYNKEFARPGFTPISYYELRSAYFPPPEEEEEIMDRAEEDLRLTPEFQNLSAEQQKIEINQARLGARRDSRTKAQKNLQYKMIDVQLHRLDPNIPPGFAQKMIEGTDEERVSLALNYLGSAVLKDINLPPQIKQELINYFDPTSPYYHDRDRLTQTGYNWLGLYIDQHSFEWFGFSFQPGTGKLLIDYAKNKDFEAFRKAIWSLYENLIFGWADSQFGLPLGTVKTLALNYRKLEKARQIYIQAGRTTQAASAYNQVRAEVVVFVVSLAFEKDFVKMDQKLGLVPGTTAGLVGAGIQYWLAGTNPVTAVAFLIVLNLFGYYKVDLRCSGCGYYPESESPSKGDPNCPLSVFNGLSSSAFRNGAIAAARWKVKQLIEELLVDMPAHFGKDFSPTQIMTLREEDVEEHSSKAESIWGPAGGRERMGMWSNPLMGEYIHIGF